MALGPVKQPKPQKIPLERWQKLVPRCAQLVCVRFSLYGPYISLSTPPQPATNMPRTTTYVLRRRYVLSILLHRTLLSPPQNHEGPLSLSSLPLFSLAQHFTSYSTLVPEAFSVRSLVFGGGDGEGEELAGLRPTHAAGT